MKRVTLTTALLAATVLTLGSFATLASLRAAPQPAPAGAEAVKPLILNKGDHIALLGGALADRLQHDGSFEALVYAHLPAHELVFRNLSASGDEVATWQRSDNFGSRDEWLKKAKADVIFAFYGYNESFKGEAGLAEFKGNLEQFLKSTLASNYSGKGPPRVVLFSPTADEKLQSPDCADVTETNARLKTYVAAMAEVARANGVLFVDLYTPSLHLYAEAAKQGKALTVDTHYLTDAGNQALAPVMFQGVFGTAEPSGDLAKLKAAIVDKNEQWHSRYRTVDGYNVYGGRSQMAYESPAGSAKITNYKVMQEEMTQRDVLTANRDAVVWAAAQGKELKPDDSNLPPVTEVKSNKPGPGPEATWPYLSGEEAISKMTLAKGLKVNLFASEEQFPQLVNPVQMAWDTKGRLWVSVWPSYPERTPTSKTGDAILIFEDTNGDGKADKATPFIENLNCPTGFQFYKDGILLMQAPDLWYVPEDKATGKAGPIERVLMGMDSADSHHTTNSMVLDPGGAVYLSDGVFHRTQVETTAGPVRNEDGCIYRYEPRTGRFERHAPYGYANPHGRVFDYWGNDFITDATGNNTYFGPAISGMIDYPAKHSNIKDFWNRPSRPCPGTGILSSRHFPADFDGNFLNINVISFQGIYRVKMDPDGSGVKGETIPDPLISSSDPNFRPTGVTVGPDGAAYVIDWSQSIIGHLQHHLRDPNRDHGHGRIYRLTAEGRPLLVAPKIDGQPIPALLELLKLHEDGTRTLAKIELGKRDPAAVVAEAKKWVETLDKADPAYEHHVTEALWVHQWMNVVDEPLLKRLLRSPEPNARAAATRVLCYWGQRVPGLFDLLKVQAGDQNPRVRLEAVRAASFFKEPGAVDVALASLNQPTDYYLTYVMGETMKQLGPIWRKALAQGKAIATDNPAGANYLIKSVSTPELLKLPKTPAVLLATLLRPDVPDATRSQTLVDLAELKKVSSATLLLDSLELLAGAGDAPGGDVTLARLLPAQSPDDLKALRDRLEKLATTASSVAVRQPAWAAVITADQSLDAAWTKALATPALLNDVLGAIPFVFDPDLRGTGFDRVKPLLAAQLPAQFADTVKAAPGGRFVRIELPQPGTLTLAEVQVLNGSGNIAKQGKATQSSVGFGGEPARAIDGNTDGGFGSGTQTHTTEGDLKPWWEVDLGREAPIESIVIWNRTESGGLYAGRLADFTVIVLDSERHEIFRKAKNPAPAGNVKIAVSTDGSTGSLRAAAIRAAVSMTSHQPAVFAALADLIIAKQDVPAAARGIRTLARKAWDPTRAAAAADALVAWATTIPAGDRTGQDFVETVQFTGDLAGYLPPEQAASIRKVLKELRVAVFVVNTVREQMRYDAPRLVVEAGKPFEIIIENLDFMPHNLVVVNPGTRPEIGKASATMKPDQLDAKGRPFIPNSPDVLAGTRLLEPGQSEALKMTAPSKEGDYDYVCTYPGHWEMMWGRLVVTKDVDAYLAANPDFSLAAAPKGHEHNHK